MPHSPAIITVTLNPAIDRIIEVEGLAPGSHQEGRELLRVPAGKGINVSRALAAMGVPSTATGFLGDGNRAEFAAALKGLGIADEFLTLPGWTRENITLTDRRHKQDMHVRFPGLAVDRAGIERLGEILRRLTSAQPMGLRNGTSRGERPGATLPRRVGKRVPPDCPGMLPQTTGKHGTRNGDLAGTTPIVIFSGSLPPGVAPEDLADLVTICLSGGARVAVDTSGPALGAVAAKPLWLVKPNFEELPQLVGRRLHGMKSRLLAAKALARRIPNVILSGGAKGAWLFAPGLSLHAVAPVDPQQVRSTVGCGDALLAAYVGGLAKGLDARRAFTAAVASASASATTPGPAEFDPGVAEAIRRNAQVTELV